MRKIIFVIMTSAVCAAMVSCTREQRIEEEMQNGEFVSMTVNASVEATKLNFGAPTSTAYPINWSAEGESVRLYERVDASSWSPKTFSVSYTPSSNLRTASFKFNATPQTASRFDYYVIYPGNGLTYQIQAIDSQDNWLKTVRVGTAGVQVPVSGGPDSRFCYLAGKVENLSKQPSSLDVNFAHVLAYAKLTVRGLALPAGEQPSAIRVSFNNKTHVTGFIDWRVETGETVLTRANASKNYVEIDPKNLTVSSTGFDVWFAIAPLTVAGGESMTFSFTTEAGDVTKTVFIPDGKPLEFKKGRVLEFSVDMAGTSIPKTLQFDFSSQDGVLPTGVASPYPMRQWYTFTKEDALGSGKYRFYNAGGVYHGSTNAYSTIYDGSNTGYLGLPAIPGYKLSRINVNRGAGTGASVNVEVLSDVASKTAITEQINFPKGIATPSTIVLTGTKENTVYWMHSIEASYVPLGTLTLEYEIADASDAHETGYDVFLLLGQSNMAGRGEYERTDCNPIPGVYLFTDGDNVPVYAAQPFLNLQSSIRKGYSMQKFNLGGAFGAKVHASTGRKVLLIVNARGGTTIENWLGEGDPLFFSEDAGDEGYLWGTPMPGFLDEAVRRARAAAAFGTLRAVLWHQGEGNSSAEKAPQYLAKLQTLVSSLRTSLGMTAEELPFIVGELNYALSGAANLNPYLNQVSGSVQNSACVSADGCASKDDNTHFTKEGLTLLGERYADKYLEMTR